jgi:hypothetical protein
MYSKRIIWSAIWHSRRAEFPLITFRYQLDACRSLVRIENFLTMTDVILGRDAAE